MDSASLVYIGLALLLGFILFVISNKKKPKEKAALKRGRQPPLDKKTLWIDYYKLELFSLIYLSKVCFGCVICA